MQLGALGGAQKCPFLRSQHSRCHGNNDCLFEAWCLIFIQKRSLAIQRSDFMNVETQFLYPFLNALRKISRAIFFEHIALTESSLF